MLREIASPRDRNSAGRQPGSAATALHRFREEFNCERPHEALGQSAPAKHYAPSPRCHPARLEALVYSSDYQLRRVRHNGEIKWRGELVFVSVPLIGEIVEVRETPSGDAELYFGPVPLG